MSLRLNELSHSGFTTSLWHRLFCTAPFILRLILLVLLCSGHQTTFATESLQTVATGQVKIPVGKPISNPDGKPVKAGGSSAVSVKAKTTQHKAHPALVVRVTEPTNLKTAKVTPLTIKGTVSDPKAKITVNGILATNNKGKFQADIPLQQGLNTLQVTAEDAQGHSSTDTLTVSFGNSSPAVTSQTSPQSAVIRTSEQSGLDLNDDNNPAPEGGNQNQAPLNNSPTNTGNSVSQINPANTAGGNGYPINAINNTDNSGNRGSPTSTNAPQAQTISGTNQAAQTSISHSPTLNSITESSNPQPSPPTGFAPLASLSPQAGEGSNSSSPSLGETGSSPSTSSGQVGVKPLPLEGAGVAVKHLSPEGRGVGERGLIPLQESSSQNSTTSTPSVTSLAAPNNTVSSSSATADQSQAPATSKATPDTTATQATAAADLTWQTVSLGLVQLQTATPSRNPRSKDATVDITLTNIGTDTLTGPFRLAIASLKPVSKTNIPKVSIAGSSGYTKANEPIIDLITHTGTSLAPNATVNVTVTVKGGGPVNFSFTPRLEQLAEKPLIVRIAEPATLITVGATPLRVKGTVSDSTAKITVNGGPITNNNGSFQADVTLQEGHNTVQVRAVNDKAQDVTDSIAVSLDMTPPYITLESPKDGDEVRVAMIPVSGLVNDIVRGTVAEGQARVTVNGFVASISNRSYLAENIPLQVGNNTLVVNAADNVGNTSNLTLHITYKPLDSQHIELVSGQDQTARIGTVLSQPLKVKLLDGQSKPVAGKPVIFRVTQDDGFVGVGTADPGQATLVNTDASGIASTPFKLGSRAGTGNQRVRAASVGYDGEVNFYASAQTAPGDKVTVNSGNNQRGAINQPLPQPFVVTVVDSGANVVQGAQIEFKVTQGYGTFQNGKDSTLVTTDSDGRASAEMTLGPAVGLDVHRATATLVGTSLYAGFTASGLKSGLPGLTTISGLVLDNQDKPLPKVTVRVDGTTRQAETDAKGQFTITEAPVGAVRLIADGSTSTEPGEWPTLAFNIVTVAGADNPLAAPIYLVKLDTNLATPIGVEDVTLALPEVPGFALEVKAGSATFPDGSKTGKLSVTPVNASKIPMPPPNGMQPQFIVTIQPVGTRFNPPARLTLPNVDGHLPGAQVEMYSYDHDLEEFVAIGLGTVSKDGKVIKSNDGVGVIKAGWHCGSLPGGKGCAHKCPECYICKEPPCDCYPNPGSCCTKGVCDNDGNCLPLILNSVTLYANNKNAPSSIIPWVKSGVNVQFRADVKAVRCVMEYEWDFGDGHTLSENSGLVNHTYTAAGEFSVNLVAKCVCKHGSPPKATMKASTIIKFPALGGSCVDINGNPVPSGSACNDGNACTNPDKCDNIGNCISGSAVVCPGNGGNMCAGSQSCDRLTGSCVLGPPPSSGASCGACFNGGACNGQGACAGGTPVNCPDDGNNCNGPEHCDATQGCISGPAIQIGNIEAKADGLHETVSVPFRDIQFTSSISQTNCNINDLKYAWDFGDGTTSDLPNPVHSYNNPGKEYIALISITCGTCVTISTAQAKIALPVINVNRISSGQFGISSNANYLPGMSGQDGNRSNVLLLAARSNQVLSVNLNFDIIPSASYISNRLLFRYKSYNGDLLGNSVVNGTDAEVNFNTQGKLFINTNSSEYYSYHYDLSAAIDLNSDGVAQQEEIIYTKNPGSISAVNDLTYSFFVRAAKILDAFGFQDIKNLPITRAFLTSFLDDAPIFGLGPEKQPILQENIVANDSLLSHNVGAIFDSNRNASIRHQIYEPNSTISRMVMVSKALEDSIFNTFHCHAQDIKQGILSGTKSFTFTIITGRIGGGGCGGNAINFTQDYDPDLRNSFGQTNINATLSATFNLNGDIATLNGFTISGQIGPDLYDWQQGAGSMDSALSVIQAGYNTLGSSGHVFRISALLDGSPSVYFDPDLYIFNHCSVNLLKGVFVCNPH